jgi:hypothetical protein
VGVGITVSTISSDLRGLHPRLIIDARRHRVAARVPPSPP